MLLTIGLSAAFVLIASATFAIWMRPPRDTSGRVDFFPMAAAVTGLLFFLACFAVGVWFSLARAKGETWML
jgi:hypothetical protein